jgi:hypothetical protein
MFAERWEGSNQAEPERETGWMGLLNPEINDRLANFITAQPVFFVATAPLSPTGHINCSPKGNDGTLAIVDKRRVAYLDLTGSGIETVAHLKENGRILLMFCAFAGPPRIVRLHGTGQVTSLGEPGYDEVAAPFGSKAGARAVIVVHIERISDSCGYGVPLMSFERHRDNLDHWVDTKGPDGLVEYRADKNTESIDGLPGLPRVSA